MIIRGHVEGDFECPMINFNPHDWARQNHEDPVNFMKNQLQVQKQKLILRHASLPADMRFSFETGEEREKLLQQLVYSDEDDEDDESKILINLLIIYLFIYYLFIFLLILIFLHYYRFW